MTADSRMREILAGQMEKYVVDSPLPELIRTGKQAYISSEPALEAMRRIRAETIEECAKECEIEAGYNDAVAADEKDMLCVRAQAEQSASTKRHCAMLIRTLLSETPRQQRREP